MILLAGLLRIKTACKVKLADLSDNMDLSRISNPIQEDYQRAEKYRKASERIFETMDFENDNEYRVSKEIEINGCVLVPQSCSEDDFLHKFIDFIENNYWSFGGGVKEINEVDGLKEDEFEKREGGYQRDDKQEK